MLGTLKNTIKAAVAFLCSLPAAISGKKERNVLCYHGVGAAEAKAFGNQMDALSRRFTIVPPSEILTAEAKDRPVVSLIFDDAFRSVKDNALPALRKRAIPAAIAVPVAHLNERPGWEMEEGCPHSMETVMTMDEIAELAADGWEIQSHTMTHPKLAELNDEGIRHELRESKKRLDAALPVPVTAVCYPHGSHDERVVEEARNAGYLLGFTIIAGPVRSGGNTLAINRTVVSPTERTGILRLKASGAYGIFPRIRSLLGMSR